MATKTAPDSSRRSDRSRRAIYDAALALVTEVGYTKTTIEAIASRAGVGKQTIYRWWSSKAEVLLEAFVDLGHQAETQAAEAAGEQPGAVIAALPDTGDVATDLKYVLRTTVDELLDPKYDAPYRALAAAGMDDRKLSEDFVKLLMPAFDLYSDRLRAAQEPGRCATGSTYASPWSCSSHPSPSAGCRAPDRSRTSTPTRSSTTPCTAWPRATDPRPEIRQKGPSPRSAAAPRPWPRP